VHLLHLNQNALLYLLQLNLLQHRVTDQNNAIARAKSVQPSLQSQLVTGLEGGWGSTIGPGGGSVCARWQGRLNLTH